MNYFKNCTSLDDAKNLFRKLCFELHPDKGGKASDFIEMRKQFETFAPQKTENKEAFNFDKFENIIFVLSRLNSDVKIEFIGTWIYLTDNCKGATYMQRETIKELILEGYNKAQFSKSKKAWYFAPEGTNVFKKRGVKLDDLKQRFGAVEMERKQFNTIRA